MSAIPPPLPAVDRDRTLVRVAAVVLALTLFLLPIGRVSELGVLGSIVISALLIARFGLRPLKSPTVTLLLALFACYAVPAWVSLIGAVDFERSFVSALSDLRFLPLALMSILILRERTPLYLSIMGISGLIVAVWALDAWIQGITGFGLAGALDSDRVSGVFGDGNLKLGPVLAVLSPLLLEEVRRRYGRGFFALAWLLLAVAILLAGARAGWIMYALVTLVMLWRIALKPSLFVAWLAASAVAIGALGLVTYQLNPLFAERVERTLSVGDGSVDAIDYALAGRLPIWQTALRMSLDNPLNGVGVRGFREAYPRYADADDPWVSADRSQGALHPHHVGLELSSELGLVGLLAWLIGGVLALRAWWRASRAARDRAFAPGLALLVMLFPLNTHFAFYSSFWGLLLWWLVALWCAGLSERAQDNPR